MKHPAVLRRHPLTLGLLALLHAPLQAAALPAIDANDGAEVGAAHAAVTLDGLSVIGNRQTRQQQAVGAVEIAASAPGTNPIKVLEKLPGVHFVASDPWGSYEWSNRIAIRGFAQNQLGYTLDGIPLGDNSYANSNGLSPNRAVSTENIALIDVAQGAGALRTASTSNLGGSLLYTTRDPSTEAENLVSLAIGNNASHRVFARYDTGQIGGFSSYLSAMSSEADKWKGGGARRQKQLNAKTLFEWGDGHRVSGWFDYSSRDETDDLDLSRNLIERCGMDWDNYAPDWNSALDAAYGRYSGCVQGKDDAYYLARGLRDDYLAGLNGVFQLDADTTLNASVYYHRNAGQGHWFTPHIASPEIPMALRVTSYDVERAGTLASLSRQFGAHQIEAGVWYERSVHSAGRSYVHIDGPINEHHLIDSSEFDGRLFRQRWETHTLQWYVQDSLQLLDDRLGIDIGFKGQRVVTDAEVIVPGRAGGRLQARDAFMPQLGARWQLNAQADVFATYSENQAAFRPGVNGAWSLTQESFDLSALTAKPESSRSLQTGIRFGNEYIEASATIYATEFNDRQLIIVPCAGVVSCPNQFANVGSASTRGAELAVVWTPVEGMRWLNSVTFNDSRYNEDYLNNSYTNPDDGSHRVPAKDKQMVDTPRHMFATELSHRIGAFNARLGGKYTGTRYYTYSNDASVPGFWLWNAGLSWERKDIGRLRQLSVALDVSNLTDKRYIATLGSNGFRDDDRAGDFQTLLPGAPRQAFLSVTMGF